MIVCPLCEHAQAVGAECEVCGQPLAAGAGGSAGAALPLDGLEPTAHAPTPGDVAPLALVEPTAYAPAPPPAPADAIALEPTHLAAVDVDAPALADLERTAAALPGDAPTALPAFPVCRYCRTPALPGERICGRCGMRLPVADAPRAQDAAPSPRCGCGVALLPGARTCPACGARLVP